MWKKELFLKIRGFRGYFAAVLASGVLVLITNATEPLLHDALFFLPVGLTATLAVLWGAGPAIVSMVLAVFAISYVFLPPSYSFRVESRADLVRMGLFLTAEILVIVVGSRMRKLLAATQKAKDELLAEKKIRERFVSTLAHDLRSPLSAARAGVELAARERAGAQKSEKIFSQVLMSLNRIDTMTQDLLDANRLQAGGSLPIQPEEMNVFAVLTRAIEDYRLLYGDRFLIDCPENLMAFWCPKAIRRIMDNLIGNAIKYGSAGTPIRISVYEERDTLKVTVHNFGPTIEKESQELLFQPFRQLIQNPSGATSGWGLGLALVRGLAVAHGGEVFINSTEKDGTTFSIVLPRRVHLVLESEK